MLKGGLSKKQKKFAETEGGEGVLKDEGGQGLRGRGFRLLRFARKISISTIFIFYFFYLIF